MFKLGRRSKSQNAGNWLGYLDDTTSGLKARLDLKMDGHFENFEIYNIG